MSTIDFFLDSMDARLDAGAQEYCDRSFARSIAETVNELDQELIDQVGWLYVLWCQAARKCDYSKDQKNLRPLWRQNLNRRLLHNDRRTPFDGFDGSASACMFEIEILAMDCFEFREQVLRRLKPIARAIEVAQVIYQPSPYRGRRGSTRDPRSDD
jgi:hypothetical protein